MQMPVQSPTLEELGKKHGTDKVEHGYLPIYDKLFSCMRTATMSMLEIGVWTGSSILMWRDYFQNGTIVGLDINFDKCRIDLTQKENKNVFLYTCDQSKHRKLVECVCEMRKKYDIIIDDGSHDSSHQQISMITLWPWLKFGGTYVIEDLHVCFTSKKYKNLPWNTYNLLTSPSTTISPFVPTNFFTHVDSIEMCDVYGNKQHITAIIKKKRE